MNGPGRSARGGAELLALNPGKPAPGCGAERGAAEIGASHDGGPQEAEGFAEVAEEARAGRRGDPGAGLQEGRMGRQVPRRADVTALEKKAREWVRLALAWSRFGCWANSGVSPPVGALPAEVAAARESATSRLPTLVREVIRPARTAGLYFRSMHLPAAVTPCWPHTRSSERQLLPTHPSLSMAA